jgi:transcription antitermination factor NusG
MDADVLAYSGGYVPGEEVNVIDGTFAGMAGRVVSPDEAIGLQGPDRCGPVCKAPPGQVWIVLTLFGRPAPVLLQPFQIMHR